MNKFYLKLMLVVIGSSLTFSSLAVVSSMRGNSYTVHAARWKENSHGRMVSSRSHPSGFAGARGRILPGTAANMRVSRTVTR